MSDPAKLYLLMEKWLYRLIYFCLHLVLAVKQVRNMVLFIVTGS